MNINFKFKGMELEAEVNVTPFVPSDKTGHPDNWMPEEGGDIEFVSLTCQGNDALFLLASYFRDDVEIAAMNEVDEKRLRDMEP